jgi:N-hydroxyarylamine O-acetyltransferase
MYLPTYLQRINYTGPLTPSTETLHALHVAHLLAVPFENLDIHLGRPIILDEAALYHKIVKQRRGGFCYELNGLFAALLRELGFNVTRLSARVARADGSFGPDFDHMALLVELEQRWLVDVGFGDSFREPLRLDEPGEQVQASGAYRLTSQQTFEVLKTSKVYPAWTLWQQDEAGQWQAQYQFTLQPRHLANYAEMCHYHQSSPESHFTQRRICSLATPEGRVTLSNWHLIITQNGQRREQLLTDRTELTSTLRDYFSVVLD